MEMSGYCPIGSTTQGGVCNTIFSCFTNFMTADYREKSAQSANKIDEIHIVSSDSIKYPVPLELAAPSVSSDNPLCQELESSGRVFDVLCRSLSGEELSTKLTPREIPEINEIYVPLDETQYAIARIIGPENVVGPDIFMGPIASEYQLKPPDPQQISRVPLSTNPNRVADSAAKRMKFLTPVDILFSKLTSKTTNDKLISILNFLSDAAKMEMVIIPDDVQRLGKEINGLTTIASGCITILQEIKQKFQMVTGMNLDTLSGCSESEQASSLGSSADSSRSTATSVLSSKKAPSKGAEVSILILKQTEGSPGKLLTVINQYTPDRPYSTLSETELEYANMKFRDLDKGAQDHIKALLPNQELQPDTSWNCLKLMIYNQLQYNKDKSKVPREEKPTSISVLTPKKLSGIRKDVQKAFDDNLAKYISTVTGEEKPISISGLAPEELSGIRKDVQKDRDEKAIGLAVAQVNKALGQFTVSDQLKQLRLPARYGGITVDQLGSEIKTKLQAIFGRDKITDEKTLEEIGIMTTTKKYEGPVEKYNYTSKVLEEAFIKENSTHQQLSALLKLSDSDSSIRISPSQRSKLNTLLLLKIKITGEISPIIIKKIVVKEINKQYKIQLNSDKEKVKSGKKANDRNYRKLTGGSFSGNTPEYQKSMIKLWAECNRLEKQERAIQEQKTNPSPEEMVAYLSKRSSDAPQRLSL